LAIAIQIFRQREQPASYLSYRRIKYDVFSRELGWAGLEDLTGEPIAREDPFDDAGRFVLARTEAGVPVGVVRGIGLDEGFPHRNLFERHFDDARFQRAFPRLITANALAVLSEYRKRNFRVVGCNWSGSAGMLLMLALFQSFDREDRIGAVITAGGIESALFFRKLGCLVIDPPCETALHCEPLTNFGIVFGTDGHRMAAETCCMSPGQPTRPNPTRQGLQDYFRHCQERSLGSKLLESWFRS